MSSALTLLELAELVGASVVGDGAALCTGVAPLESATATELSQFHHPSYREAFEKTQAVAVVVRPKTAGEARTGRTLLVCDDPVLAFAKAASHFHPKAKVAPGIDPRAVVEATAQIDVTAEVGPLAFVGAGAKIGPRTVLAPLSHVGKNAVVGGDCQLGPHSVVADGCILGDRVSLHPGAVVGSDGFGYVFDGSVPEHRKVPQVGIARVEDDVEIGANACVDRATLGETVIGRGTKIDNLVQVAHNVKVGPLSILCAQAGVAGSTTLGTGVVLGGQVGVIGHLNLGDGVKIGAGSGVMTDLAPGETHSGAPVLPQARWLRKVAFEKGLSEFLRRFAALEKRVAGLTKEAAPARGEERKGANRA